MSKEEAEKFKALGNDFFNKKQYIPAVENYTKAIDVRQYKYLFLSCRLPHRMTTRFWLFCMETGKNGVAMDTHCARAFANLKMENFGFTLADSDKALELDPSYIKAYYRKGSAHMVLQKFQDALADFKKVTFS